jgi:hypothetical protein
MCPTSTITTTSNAKESIMQTETTMCVAEEPQSQSHNDHSNDDASEAPNLAACTPETLFRWLLVNRFNNDEQAVQAFLTQAASTSSQARPAAVSSQAKDGTPAPALSSSSLVDLGESLIVKAVEVSCTTPRGKFQFDFCRQGIQCTDKKGNTMTIPAGAVEHCVIFPKPEDCQPVTRKNVVVTDQVLLVFNEDAMVTYKNSQKPLSQVCLALPADLPIWKKKHESDDEDDDDDDDDGAGLDRTDQYTRLLAKSLSLDMGTQIIRVANPAAPEQSSMSTFWRYQFVSHQEQGTSTTTAGMPFVKCYAGVNDGVLYPLQEGLLFFKPPRLVPRSNLQAISCGRGGAGNASRYVDMILTLSDDSTTEFTNIHRSELPVLREYIHSVLIPAMQKDADDDGGGAADAKADSPSVASAASDTSTRQRKENAHEEPVPSGRPGKRKASVEARAVTQRMRLESDDDEEEGDDDFVAEKNSDDDEDSEEESGDNDEGDSEDEDENQGEADEATESEDE